MTCSNCNCGLRWSCVGVAIVASIIIGIITAFLTFAAVITVTPAFLWVVLGIAVVYLAITLVTSVAIRNSGIRDCVCNILPILLIAILGVILVSIILLGVAFAATSVIGAIVTGLLLTFFSLVVSLVACLVRCVVGCTQD